MKAVVHSLILMVLMKLYQASIVNTYLISSLFRNSEQSKLNFGIT